MVWSDDGPQPAPVDRVATLAAIRVLLKDDSTDASRLARL